MLKQFLMAGGAILMLLLGWIAVQKMARAFARRHPEFGAYREAGTGCGTGKCACASIDHCRKRDADLQ
ncbi:hypothetical protein [Sulfurivermis fontis]|uniref:hypothetical protein n=1 Tax=Sulfurivermis fontis TaxID=1972068 RepID=UPI000FDB461E|nr:hypothetical protein [Sulfurivermis fontis]